MRVSEALNAQWSDVRKSDRGEEIWIRSPKTTKSGIKIKRMRIEGGLRDLIERIRKRGIIGQTMLCDENGQRLLAGGKFRYRFYKARSAAKQKVMELTQRFDPEKIRDMVLEWFDFQFRDLWPKAATDKEKERAEGMNETRRFLDHTTEKQTADYVRDRIGELVGPVNVAFPEWMAKVLSPKDEEVFDLYGDESRNRTGVHGFAGRCITTLPSRQRGEAI